MKHKIIYVRWARMLKCDMEPRQMNFENAQESFQWNSR